MFYSINRHILISNRKHNRNDPPIRVAETRSGSALKYVHQADIPVGARIVYDQLHPLKCGAQVWVETDE
jgi:hypothetical protein